MHYTYTHTGTKATTGYFSCEPEPVLALEDALARLEAAPMDIFLHRAVLRDILHLSEAALRDFANNAGQSPVLTALLQECALLHPDMTDIYDTAKAIAVLDYTPLPLLRAHAALNAPDAPNASDAEIAALHRAWTPLFAANITEHRALPHPDEGELALLYSPDSVVFSSSFPRRRESNQDIRDIHTHILATPAPPHTHWSRPPAQETAAHALELLEANGIIAGVEMRHEASLAPVALQRSWNIHIAVHNGVLDYTLRGTANAYGRGLTVAAARASCLMEIVERASAYATVQDNSIIGLTRPVSLIRARLSEVCAHNQRACDPNSLSPDAPYTNQPLYWLKATEAGSNESVLVPAQCVYLFCNLDEPALCDTPGSTGLAAGNTLDEAKVAALLECIERDAEATIPYDRRRCFVVRSEDARLQALLDSYAARGIYMQCMDLTSTFGVPCYQCFVMGRDGGLRRATGAHLNGKRALLSALTEVPWPYTHNPASSQPVLSSQSSQPGLSGLPVRILERLPDYSLESPAREIILLEAVLTAHGYTPLYVELTRADLMLPVVRALIPGLEHSPRPDGRIPPRLFANYLAMHI